jgi:hypothetical protein
MTERVQDDSPEILARRLGSRQWRLLREALRRYTRFHQGKPLTQAWTGLGSATTYKPAVDGGYMEMVHEPNPRCLCWWRLTEKGAALVQAWIARGEDYKTVEADDTNGVFREFELVRQR